MTLLGVTERATTRRQCASDYAPGSVVVLRQVCELHGIRLQKLHPFIVCRGRKPSTFASHQSVAPAFRDRRQPAQVRVGPGRRGTLKEEHRCSLSDCNCSGHRARGCGPNWRSRPRNNRVRAGARVLNISVVGLGMRASPLLLFAPSKAAGSPSCTVSTGRSAAPAAKSQVLCSRMLWLEQVSTAPHRTSRATSRGSTI
jgi:hypothetical protein